MGIGEAAVYSLMGICIVFFALILLMCIIKIMMIDFKSGKKNEAPAGEQNAHVAPAVEKPLAPGTAGELKLYDTDPRDAAMIMAIVADTLGKPLNELRFISIREVER